MTVTTDRSVAGDATGPATRPVVRVGRVEAIHVADAKGAPMRPVDRVPALAGVGLVGDRYAARTGHWSPNTKVDRDITLIAAEEIDRLATELDIHLRPGETRRNVTTRGIDVNGLVGRRFRIGAVECEGSRLCEPCQYLTDLLGKPVLQPLVHRAGLRARILVGGDIALDDEIVPLD
jgi:MOSC domain-containing protein YiiM